MKKTPPFIDNDSSDSDFFRLVDFVTSGLHNVLDEVRYLSKIDPSRGNRLRFSSLPFCGVRWMIKKAATPQGEEFTSVDFGFKYFTSVGHVVHEIMQTGIDNSEILHALNDYVCKDCESRYFLRKNKPKECKNCGCKSFTREEHEITWRGGLGHVDEILLLSERDGKKYVFVMDYKTTSLFGINKPDPPGYLCQLSSYSVGLMSENPNIVVVGYGLVYIPRDAPFRFRVSPYRLGPIEIEKVTKRFVRWKRRFDEAGRVKTKDEFMKLLDTRPCKEKMLQIHSDCEHSHVCAGCSGRPEQMEFLMEDAFKKLRKFLPVVKTE